MPSSIQISGVALSPTLKFMVRALLLSRRVEVPGFRPQFQSAKIYGGAGTMRLQERDHWICQNTACSAEVIVVASSRLNEGSNPRCSCGSVMKKPYVVPLLRNLERAEAEMVFERDEITDDARVA